MKLTVTTDDGVAVIRIDGDLDRANIGAFTDLLAGHLGVGQHRLLVNLEACPYLDSAGLAALLAFLEAIRHDDGILAVVGPQPQVRRILEIVGLLAQDRFRVYGDEAAARSSLKGSI